jgi:type IV pilus assembly protein PilN
MGLLHTIAGSQEQLVAVYISPATIGVAVVDERKRLPKVSAYDFIAIEQEEGAFTPRSFLELPELAAETLQQLLKRNKIGRKDVSISIPTHDVILRKAQIPLMSESDFQSAASIGGLWDAFAWMPSAPGEYFVDFISFNRTESEGMTACMVAAPLSVVEQYTHIIHLAGLRTVMIDTHNFAIWRALNRWVQLEQKGQNAICEIVLAGDYVTVLKDGIPELTELYGMERLRQQLFSGGEISAEDRQQLFDSYASQVSTVLQSVNGEPTDEGGEKSTVVVLSDIPAVQQASESMAQAMEKEGMEIGDLHQIFSRPQAVANRFESEPNQAALLVTLGLGLRRLELFGASRANLWGTQVMNLLPGHQQLKKSRKRRFLLNFWSVVVGIPLMLGMIYLQMEQSREHLRLSTQMVDYERLTRSIEHLNSQLSAGGGKLKTLRQFLDVAARAGNNYPLTYRLLTHLVEQIPLGVRLDQIEWQEQGVLHLKGVAGSDDEILTLVEQLRGDRLFSRVSLTTIAEEAGQKNSRGLRSQGGKERGFLLECEVDQTAVLQPGGKVDGD